MSDEIFEVSEPEETGISWSKFKPSWDGKKFAMMMNAAGLTSSEVVNVHPNEVLGILRQCWQAELGNVREFARTKGK